MVLPKADMGVLHAAVGLLLLFFLALLIDRYMSTRANRPTGPSNVKAKPPAMPTYIPGLFISGKYSDVAVICGDCEWKLHKSILCTQSEYFSRACDGPFREAKEAVIDLKEDDESAVAAMLYYLYHADYENDHIDPPATSAALLHVKVYVIADKYLHKQLRAAAFKKLSKEVKTSWKDNSFAEVVAEAYASTPSNGEGPQHRLRTFILETAEEHASTLFATGKQHTSFKEMTRSTPECGADVASALANPSVVDAGSRGRSTT